MLAGGAVLLTTNRKGWRGDASISIEGGTSNTWILQPTPKLASSLPVQYIMSAWYQFAGRMHLRDEDRVEKGCYSRVGKMTAYPWRVAA